MEFWVNFTIHRLKKKRKVGRIVVSCVGRDKWLLPQPLPKGEGCCISLRSYFLGNEMAGQKTTPQNTPRVEHSETPFES